MRALRFDKSIIFLLLIILVVAAVGVTAYLYLRTNAVAQALKNDEILKVLFVIEKDGKPISTNVLLYYPPTRRAAVFDIPEETGLIISSLKRVDRIGVLFKPKDPGPYQREIAKLLSTEIPISIVVSYKAMGELVDILDGIELFVPNPVEVPSSGGLVLFPPGANLFDGDKVKTYLMYVDDNEVETDLVTRRQKAFLSLLKRISERAEYLAMPAVLEQVSARLSTNLDKSAVRKLIGVLSGLDAERIVPSRVQGTMRKVEDQVLLFPHYDGELLKDIVRQNLNALVNASGSGEGERIFSLEIRNGTPVKGLAKKAAALYESFGYEITATANAESDDVERTVLKDRFGNDEMAQTVANVIHCSSVVQDPPADTAAEGGADFILVLGKDFNGRYCVP
jgi:anionic cell wall polymer biosynthesis LytR-Cps2A-Psr (LCP) family protein